MTHAEEDTMLRAVFDALPSLVFVVDQDVRIQEYNAAASELLMADRATVLKRRAGDILHCIHAGETAEGCGRAPFCKDCVVRDSVTEAFHGKCVVRRHDRMEMVRDTTIKEMYALITASPLSYKGRSLVLLVIEDVSEIAELYRMIPICSHCGKVRDEQESWMRIESYFKDNWAVDFSHGICPDCYASEMEKMGARDKGE
jgi:PAS domain-containing protein